MRPKRFLVLLEPLGVSKTEPNRKIRFFRFGFHLVQFPNFFLSVQFLLVNQTELNQKTDKSLFLGNTTEKNKRKEKTNAKTEN